MSNHALAMSEKQAADTGNKRRLNYKELHNIFPANVEKDIKAEIEDGAFNAEFFWLAAVFHGYLLRCPEGSRRIHPRPVSLDADTTGLMDAATDDRSACQTLMQESLRNSISFFDVVHFRFPPAQA